jgi:hypothetical protein
MPDLARIVDTAGGFTVRVSGTYAEPPLQGHDWLNAELVVESGFVSGALPVVLTAQDLDDWGRAVERLAAGEDAEWMTESGRTPEVRVHLEDDAVRVEVDDPPQTSVTVSVWVFPEAGWVDRLRADLEAVRAAYRLG